MPGRQLLIALFAFFASAPLAAQLTVDQRLHDFQNLAALYAKRYAPYEWKKELTGFDLFHLAPWTDRIRRAKGDLEFYEICAEYVASLDDLHSSFRLPSAFAADLGLFVDIYDGKVLIEQINRTLLPASRFPFQVGDELVSVDGKSAEEWIAEFSKLRKRGNPLTTRRAAADLITYRPQYVLPSAAELGDEATVVIRRASGDAETYTIPWTKSGVPLRLVGPVPAPRPAWAGQAGAAPAVSSGLPDYLKPLAEMRNWKVHDDDHLFQGLTCSEETGESLPRRYLLGYGSRTPVFSRGFPANFAQRLGRAAADFHYSGTYEAEGFKIGYLRFPNFAPVSQAATIQELEREIEFLQQNTDGLVVDVMRNPGGGCYMLDAASRLIPYEFYFFGEEIRVTMDRISSIQSALEAAQRARAEQWIIDVYRSYLEQLQQAYRENRGRTGAIPACNQFGSTMPAGFYYLPARTVYTKPMIVLIDEFSTSAGDIFPAMLQDSRRGPLVGTRTNGAGGSTSLFPTGFFSEALSSNTNTLVLRREPVATPEYPTTRYIENVGVRPDIPLEYMTSENLLQNGRLFVEAFTAILVNHVRSGPR